MRDWKQQNIKSLVDPDDQNFQTLDCCAQTLLNNKNFEEAKRQWQKIEEICKKEDYRQYAHKKIASVNTLLQEIESLYGKANQFASEGRYEESIKCFEEYSAKSGKSVDDKIVALNQKIDELKKAKSQSVLDDTDRLKYSGQYAEAIEKYREYEQLAGLSKAQDILYCEEQLEKLSKPIAERLSYSSPAAFVNSLKKTLAVESLTAEELKTIGRKLAENVKPKEKKKWQNSASQFKGILSDEQVTELLNYIK